MMTNETQILGAALIDPATAIPAIRDRLSAEDFSEDWRPMAEAVFRLADSGPETVDLSTLVLELGGLWTDTLMRLMSETPTAANIEYHVARYADYSARCQLARSATQIVEATKQGEGVTDLQRRVQAMQSIGVSAHGPVHVATGIPGAIEQIQSALSPEQGAGGVQTGISTIDHLIHQLRGGDMCVIAARPSIGKTAVALQIACNITEQGHGVGMFSLEMGLDQLCVRLLGNIAEVNMEALMRGHGKQADSGRLTDAATRLKALPLHADDEAGITVPQLRARATRLVQQEGCRVILIDYLQLLHGEQGRNQSRENVVSRQSSSIKNMAKELGVPVILLAQLNRQSGDDRPKLHHLRESGAIEQDADIVGLLHRDDRQSEEMECIIAKHRNGPTGTALLRYDLKTQRIEGRSRFDDKAL